MWVIYFVRFLFCLIFWIFFVGQLRVISLCRFWPKCPCGLMVRPRTCQYCKPAIPRGFFYPAQPICSISFVKKNTFITSPTYKSQGKLAPNKRRKTSFGSIICNSWQHGGKKRPFFHRFLTYF